MPMDLQIADHYRVLYYDFKDCKPDQKYVAYVQDNRPMINEYEANLVKVGAMDTVSLVAVCPASRVSY